MVLLDHLSWWNSPSWVEFYTFPLECPLLGSMVEYQTGNVRTSPFLRVLPLLYIFFVSVENRVNQLTLLFLLLLIFFGQVGLIELDLLG